MRGRPNLVSVVVTVRNEQRHLRDLLDSLVVQEPPFEILVVDSASTDGTREIARAYGRKYPAVKLLEHPGTRGASRNFGVEQASGEVVAFTDGDCIANPFWLKELRDGLASAEVVAGRTIQIGYWAFESLERVELRHKNLDVTHPSCNLAYWRDTFRKVAGFDDRFRTAEDIDLNLRAVDAGARLDYNADAIVYHRARDTFTKFFAQAFWNGYGRKQLTLKHGSLWSSYSFRRMLKSQASMFGFLRLGFATLGYMLALAREKKRPPEAVP